MAAVDNSDLERWREVDAAAALLVMADFAKEDVTFRARGPKGTTRWHASVRGVDFEIVCTGSKFYDTRAQRGGGGAIDLAMHVLKLTFKEATAALKVQGL